MTMRLARQEAEIVDGHLPPFSRLLQNRDGADHLFEIPAPPVLDKRKWSLQLHNIHAYARANWVA